MTEEWMTEEWLTTRTVARHRPMAAAIQVASRYHATRRDLEPLLGLSFDGMALATLARRIRSPRGLTPAETRC